MKILIMWMKMKKEEWSEDVILYLSFVYQSDITISPIPFSV